MTWKAAARKAIPNVTDSNGVFTLQDLWEKEREILLELQRPQVELRKIPLRKHSKIKGPGGDYIPG